MDDIKKKIDIMSADITEIKISTAKMAATLENQQKSLDVHIRRTDLLEEKVDILKSDLDKRSGMKELILFIAKASSLVGLIVAAAKRFF